MVSRGLNKAEINDPLTYHRIWSGNPSIPLEMYLDKIKFATNM